MSSHDRVRWHCLDRDCNCWYLAATEELEQTPPRCICGRTMQREADEMSRYLGFLRERPADEITAESK
jgi:hypothetical protein